TIASAGNVNVNDFMPSGLTVTAVNASGWNCSGTPTSFMNCSRSDSLAGGASYPAITLTVSVAPTTPVSVINQANLSGGGDSSNHSANDPTIINLPDLAFSTSHTGDFTVGQTG